MESESIQEVKGIILAGGTGSRLFPLTLATSKQLLPVHDKPMIYYSLSMLMLAGVRDILLISTPDDLPNFQRLLGDGSKFGIKLSYVEQSSPDGLAQALILGEEFLSGSPCAMVLGDNIFYGNGLGSILKSAVRDAQKGIATIFGYFVKDPERFGIVEFDNNYRVLTLEEKPENPRSNYCVTGIYFYDGRASSLAKQIIPSARGELEITDLNKAYLRDNSLQVRVLGRGFTWMDAGTVDSLVEAGSFVKVIQDHQGIMVSALEEIAYHNGWITAAELEQAVKRYGSSAYGEHLQNVLDGRIAY